MERKIFSIVTNWSNSYLCESGTKVNFITFSREEAIKEFKSLSQFFLKTIKEDYEKINQLKIVAEEKENFTYSIWEVNNFSRFHFEIRIHENTIKEEEYLTLFTPTDNKKKLKNETLTNHLKETMKDCLEIRGYQTSEEKLEELWEIYEECQEWDNEVMITGKTFNEIEDFIKHSRSVEEILTKEVK